MFHYLFEFLLTWFYLDYSKKRTTFVSEGVFGFEFVSSHFPYLFPKGALKTPSQVSVRGFVFEKCSTFVPPPPFRGSLAVKLSSIVRIALNLTAKGECRCLTVALVTTAQRRSEESRRKPSHQEKL